MKPPGTNRRRTFNVRLIKRDMTYSVDDIVLLFGVHVNTVRNWLANSLIAIDHHRPTLIHGSDLTAFLRRMMSKRKQSCAPEQFYCFKCRVPRRPAGNLVALLPQGPKVRLSSKCENCGTRMFKAGSPTKLDFYAETFVLNQTGADHITVCVEPIVNCDQETGEKQP